MADKKFSVEDIINEYSGKSSEKTAEAPRRSTQDTVDISSLINSLSHGEQPTMTPAGKKVSPKTELIEDVLEIGDNKYVVEPEPQEEPDNQYLSDSEIHEERVAAEIKGVLTDELPTATQSSVPERIEIPVDVQPEPEIDSMGLRTAKETLQGTGIVEKLLDEPVAKAPEPRPVQTPQAEPKPEAQPRIVPVEEAVQRSEPAPRPIRDTKSNTAIMDGLLKLKKERGTPRNKDTKATPVNRASIDNIGLDLDSKILPNTGIGIDENATEEERLAYLNAKRRERVKQFVLEGEEEEGEPKKSKSSGIEFIGFEQAKEMAGSIASLKAGLAVRFCVLLVCSLASAYITLANDFNLPLIPLLQKSENQGMPYLFINVILGLAAFFVSFSVFSVGLGKLFTMKADSDSLAALPAAMCVISGIALLTDTEMVQLSIANLYISVALIALLMNTVGKLLIITRTERNFRYASGGYSKYAVMHIDDEDVASKFTKGALTDFPSLSTSRKTEFVSDFIKNSYSADATDAFCRYYVPIIAGISLVVGIISAILHPEQVNTVERMILFGLSCAAGTAAVCSAAGMMLVTNIPLSKASRRYLQSSAVMLGYSAVDQFADTNSVLVDSVDLFPDGMVEIINIKPTKKTPIEEGIIYAASLCCQTESILKPTFYKMIKGKTEMLYPVESYIYEDGLGLLGWIQNKRVLFGNRALMESHSIEGLPTTEKEAQYLKDDASLQYLSIGGSLAMIFVVKLKAAIPVARALRSLERRNITVILRSVDSLLSITRIAELFNVAPNMFKLLPFRYHSEYDEQTSYVAKMSSPMVYSGHFASLAMLLIGTRRLQRASTVGIAIQMLSAVLGVILSVVLSLVGIFTGVLTGSTVIAYTLLFVIVTAIVQCCAKT